MDALVPDMLKSGTVRPVPGIISVPVDDEMLLVDERARKVHRLNAAAACIWVYLEMGADSAAIARSVERIMAVPGQAVERLVASTLKDWLRLDLIRVGDSPDTGTAAMDAVAPEPDDAAADAEPSEVRERGVAARVEMQLSLAGRRFRLCFSDAALYKAAQAALAPTLVARGAEAEGEPVVISVQCKGGRINIGRGRIPELHVDRMDQVAPLVKGYLLHVAMLEGDYVLAIHAAALEAGDATLMLPGVSGAGKSTLAAGLAAMGWRCLSDDITFLGDHPRPRPEAVPLNASVKTIQGSPLDSYLGDLSDLPQCLLADGRPVRFVPLPTPPVLGGGSLVPERIGAPVEWIVFPSYRPGAPFILRPLTRAECFQRLLCHIEGPRGPLRVETLRRLAGWLSGVKAFVMEAPDLDIALGELSLLTGRARG